MKTRTLLVIVMTAIITLWANTQQAETGPAVGTAKPPKSALETVLKDLRQLEADHPKLVQSGVATHGDDEPFRTLNRARYLAKEISREEFLRRSDELTGIQRKNLERTRNSQDVLALANVVMADYALRPLE